MAKKKSKNVTVIPETKSKTVEMRKISNGFVVSTWGSEGNKEKFAKTKKEAKIIAGKLLS